VRVPGADLAVAVRAGQHRLGDLTAGVVHQDHWRSRGSRFLLLAGGAACLLLPRRTAGSVPPPAAAAQAGPAAALARDEMAG
jgi:hypothetical protein